MNVKRMLMTSCAALLIACSGIGSVAAGAEMVTNDGLTAEIITDNNYYKADEVAEAIIKITNHNDFAVTNVSLESIIPEGLIIVGEDSEQQNKVGRLEAGESFKIRVKVAQKDVPKPPAHDSSSEDSGTDPKDDSSEAAKDDSSEAASPDSGTDMSSCADNTFPVGEEPHSGSSLSVYAGKNGHEPAVNTNGGYTAPNPKPAESKPTDSAGTSAVSTTTTTTTTDGGSSQTNYKPESENSNPDTGSEKGKAAVCYAVILLLAVLFVILFNHDRKKASRIMSAVLVLMLCGGTLGEIKVAADNGKDSFTLTEQLRFEDKTYDLSAVASYDVIFTDNSVTITRGDWIKLVAETEGIDINKFDIDREHFDFFYGDTAEDENGMLYEYAHALGAVPAPDSEGYEDPEQDVPLFEADKTVTREFAVLSAVKFLGFEDGDTSLSCSDAARIKYPAAVSTALKFNMVELNGNAFNPDAPLTAADRNQIIAVMRALDDALTVDEDEKAHKVNFKDGVISDEFADITDYSAKTSDGTNYKVVLPLNDNTKKLAAGSIFVLPANSAYPNGAIFKVSSVSSDETSVTANCVIPATEEAVESMYLQDTVGVDLSKFIPEEGVYCELMDSSEKSGDAAPADLDETWNLPDAKLKLGGEFDTANGKYKYEVAFGMPSISVKYKTRWQWGLPPYVVDEAMFAPNITADVSLSKMLKESEGNPITFFENKKLSKNDIKLGKIPVALPAGFVANINLYLSVKFEGKVTVEVDFDVTTGFHYVNGAKRNLRSADISFNKIELCGEVKAGPRLTGNLTWTILPDLVGVEIFGGVAVKGAFTVHPTALLVCGDIKAYLFLELGISQDTLIGELFSEASLELIGEDNSPKLPSFHVELSEDGLHVVDECTYGSGRLVVYVTNGSKTPIKYTKVSIYDEDGHFKKCGFTDGAGVVKFTDIDEGKAVIKIKATGYKAFESVEEIRSRQETYAEAVLMVDRADDDTDTEEGRGKNYVTGRIKDAVTGVLMDADFEVRKNYNRTSGEVIASGSSSDGVYKVTLPVGYYTITFKKDGYVDCPVNVTIRANDHTEKSLAMSPELGDMDEVNVDSNAQLRVVLTWGTTPADLDSHLLGSLDSNYHIYYRNKKYSDVVAELDVDDTNGEGPETVTVYDIRENEKLSYYVHDYTNRYNPDSNAMANSGVRVAVYSGDRIVALYNTPMLEGNLWHVFDYDPDTKTITAVNTYNKLNNDEFKNYFINKYK